MYNFSCAQHDSRCIRPFGDKWWRCLPMISDVYILLWVWLLLLMMSYRYIKKNYASFIIQRSFYFSSSLSHSQHHLQIFLLSSEIFSSFVRHEFLKKRCAYEISWYWSDHFRTIFSKSRFSIEIKFNKQFWMIQQPRFWIFWWMVQITTSQSTHLYTNIRLHNIIASYFWSDWNTLFVREN